MGVYSQLLRDGRRPGAGGLSPRTMRQEQSTAQLRDFLGAVEGHHHGALFRVATMTGLRRSELCGLRWSDVGLEAGTVAVDCSGLGGEPSKMLVRTVGPAGIEPATEGL